MDAIISNMQKASCLWKLLKNEHREPAEKNQVGRKDDMLFLYGMNGKEYKIFLIAVKLHCKKYQIEK